MADQCKGVAHTMEFSEDELRVLERILSNALFHGADGSKLKPLLSCIRAQLGYDTPHAESPE